MLTQKKKSLKSKTKFEEENFASASLAHNKTEIRNLASLSKFKAHWSFFPKKEVVGICTFNHSGNSSPFWDILEPWTSSCVWNVLQTNQGKTQGTGGLRLWFPLMCEPPDIKT